MAYGTKSQQFTGKIAIGNLIATEMDKIIQAILKE